MDSRFDNGLPHRTIFSMCTGSNNKVWVGTYSGGLACYSDYNYIFKYLSLDYNREQSDKSNVSSICEDSRGYIWIGSEDEGGIKVFDPNANNFIQVFSDEMDKNTKGVKTIAPIGNNLIAIGKTYSNKIVLYNYKKRAVEWDVELPLKADPGIGGAKLCGNKLWVHDGVRLVNYDIRTKQAKAVYKFTGRILQLFFDSSHNLWIGTTKGLSVLKPGTDEVQECKFEQSVIDLNDVSIYSVAKIRMELYGLEQWDKGRMSTHLKTEAYNWLPIIN